MRVYADRSHRCYGAARRFMVILQGVIDDWEALDQDFEAEWGESWDDTMIQLLDQLPEKRAFRTLIGRILYAHPYGEFD